MSLTADPPTIDVLSPEFFPDPHPLFRRLRDEDPVHFSDRLGSWVLTTYADVSRALRDPRLSVVEVTKRLDGLTRADRRALLPCRSGRRRPLPGAAHKQVGFTSGPFSCMGQALARLEGRASRPGPPSVLIRLQASSVRCVRSPPMYPLTV